MDAVEGTRRTIRELVDGTIRVQIDIEPQYRAAFHRLFPSVDMPVALAPLKPQAVLSKAEADELAAQKTATEARKHEHHEQKLSNYAAYLCTMPEFADWLESLSPVGWREVLSAAEGDVEEACARIIRAKIGGSRSLLDNPLYGDAITKFHSDIRVPFNAWMTRRAA